MYFWPYVSKAKMYLGGVSLFWFFSCLFTIFQNKLIPPKRILALPTWCQKCIFSELQPKEISNFDLGHPVIDTVFCEKCGASFTRQKSLENHIQSIHEKAHENEFKCKLCNKTFGYKKNLQAHMRGMHESQGSFVCQLCGKCFNFNQLLTRHIKHIHENVKSDPCPHCGKICGNNQQLKKHIRVVHDGIRDIECKLCGKLASSHSNMKRHMKTHSSERNNI